MSEHVLKLYGLKSLKRAKRESWPWWDARMDVGRVEAVMPDFASNDAAAVQLLAKMALSSEGVGVNPPSLGGDNEWCFYDKGHWHGHGPTLGAALLDALDVCN